MRRSAKIKNNLGIKIHPSARIEENVTLGDNTSVWDHVHIRKNTRIGHDCIIGEKTYIAYNVEVGNFVKINAFVYIPTGVTLEDKVMISAGCIFVNDRYPRAFDSRKGCLASSEVQEETLKTLVREGATLGAQTTVLGNLEIGRYALVGAGSVVTKSVPDQALVVGNPARQIGWVCVCGPRLNPKKNLFVCPRCQSSYKLRSKKLLPNDTAKRDVER